MKNHDELMASLDRWYDLTYTTILSRQNEATGLFPASTDVNGHGDYTDAWVRDNVYSIMAIWGLWLAYKKAGVNPGRTAFLHDSVIKLMRGLLSSMMGQSHKVERFKYTQNPLDALHAKYNTKTGKVVVDDDKWGHLQLDATSIYLLMMAQMTQSGLKIVQNVDEVNFVQNLVWYISRGYRTPDFGIWERGNKINNGHVEINASSVGMVKSALQAMKGIDLLPEEAGNVGVIHVLPDEIARCRTTLENLLPRESLSKEVDAACLSVIGFPAFAVEKADLVETTRHRILDKLAGPYGCKRFLWDGHQTALEDHNRLHYEQWELKNFEHIESEWPLFYTFLFLEALFFDDEKQIEFYRDKLNSLRVEKDGMQLLPELYFVRPEDVDAEKKNPGSQIRQPNANVPLVWTQSLYTLGCLVDEGLLEKHDIDPIHAHTRVAEEPNNQLSVVILAESDQVKTALAIKGLTAQTLEDLEPVRVFPASELSRVYQVVGKNQQLALTGRPKRNPRVITTARVYELGGETVVFLPQFANRDRFYLGVDNLMFANQLRSEIAYVSRHWDVEGKDAVIVVDVRQSMLNSPDSDHLIQLLQRIRDGKLESLQTRVVPFMQHLSEFATEVINDLQDYSLPVNSLYYLPPKKKWLPFDPMAAKPYTESVLGLLLPENDSAALLSQLTKTKNIFEQASLLKKLVEQHGLDYQSNVAPLVTLRLLVAELYRTASEYQYWSVLRSSAGLLDKYWSGLEDSVTEILSRQRLLVVGRAFSDQGTISSPMQNKEIVELIRSNTAQDPREAILNQEILTMIAYLMRGKPSLLKGMISIRPGHLAMLIMGQLSDEQGIEPDEAFEVLAGLPPSELQARVEMILGHYKEELGRLYAIESLRINPEGPEFKLLGAAAPEEQLGSAKNWLQWREEKGVMPRLASDFYERFWNLLEHCRGVVVGDRFDSRSRLEAGSVLQSMTAGEQQFALLIERLLNKIESPSYRQLTLEALLAIMSVSEANPDVQLNDYLVVEVIIAHAVRIFWVSQNADQEHEYNLHRGEAWQEFYKSPPADVSRAIGKAMSYLVQQGHADFISDGGLGESVH